MSTAILPEAAPSIRGAGPSARGAGPSARVATTGSRPAGPAGTRDVTVDIARAWCLTVVVGLHALMVGVSVGASGPVLANALEHWPWLAPFTWLAQIMPLFVVLGGFSSFMHWGRMRERGVGAGEYVALRMRRLVVPAVTAVGAVVVALAALTLGGVPRDIVATAGFRLSQPLWFLGVYILCTAFVPALYAAHRRAPLATVAALAALVIAVDVVRSSTGITAVGFANLLFVWLLVQQLGFWLASGRVSGLSRPALSGVAVGSLTVLFVLAATGVYSFDMLANLNPPTLALVLLGLAQLAVFALVRPALQRLAGIRMLVRAVSAMNARAMTIYLWHMLVLIALAALLLLSGARLPVPLMVDWWMTRPLWLAAVAVSVAGVVAIAGRSEAGRPRAGRTVAGQTVAVSTGTPASPGSLSLRLRPFLAAAAASGGVLIILVTGYSLAGGVAGLALLLAATRMVRFCPEQNRRMPWAVRERTA